MYFNPPELRGCDGRLFDRILISRIRQECVVGIYRVERVRRQPLLVDIALYLDTRAAARSADLRQTIDYAEVHREIRFILSECRFYLVETAAEALCNYLLAAPRRGSFVPNIEAVAVRLAKPEALKLGAVPEVQILRTRTDVERFAPEKTDFGAATLLHRSADCVIRRLEIAPSAEVTSSDTARLPGDATNGLATVDITCDSELTLVTAGSRRTLPAGRTASARPRVWRNTTDVSRTLVTVHRELCTVEDLLARVLPAGGLEQSEIPT